MASWALESVGVPHYRAQFIMDSTAEQASHWRREWASSNLDSAWILSESAVYHEGIALMSDGELLMLDTTDMAILDPRSGTVGHRPLAVRLFNVLGPTGSWALPQVVQGWLPLTDEPI